MYSWPSSAATLFYRDFVGQLALSTAGGVVFTGDRQLEIRDFPDPRPGPGEVVLADASAQPGEVGPVEAAQGR